MNFPNDEDGQVLQMLAEQGVDLSQALDIEFAVVAPGEAEAKQIQQAMRAAGFATEYVYDEGEPDEDGVIDPDDEEFGPSWAIYSIINMEPKHSEIIRIQDELTQIVKPLGGQCDGWGVEV